MSNKRAVVDISLNSPGGPGVTIIAVTVCYVLLRTTDVKLAPSSENVRHHSPTVLRHYMKSLGNVRNGKRFSEFHTLPVTEHDAYSTVISHMLVISASNDNETAML
jgi:hypothetical protein